MATSGVKVLEIKVKEAQLEFLENKAEKLGISKEELVKLYIINDMLKTFENITPKKKKRISLEGITSGSTVTDDDFEEAKRQWNPKLP
ncbi:hypothetical protein FJZ33_05545 [Candidatus Poribacteria bacterium]|nr:hypothetical protein [Candidatus Poribacteria bacterium]